MPSPRQRLPASLALAPPIFSPTQTSPRQRLVVNETAVLRKGVRGEGEDEGWGEGKGVGMKDESESESKGRGMRVRARVRGEHFLLLRHRLGSDWL